MIDRSATVGGRGSYRRYATPDLFAPARSLVSSCARGYITRSGSAGRP